MTTVEIIRNVQLAPLTTIGLGGNASCFLSCITVDDIRAGLDFADNERLTVQVISGGSNIIFRDEGFDGLVMKIGLRGITFQEDGDSVTAVAAAGEDWDAFVRQAVVGGYAGIECLSGIPGSAGATPIQNVGAYGQEVRDTILTVQALDRHTRELVEFRNEECEFAYRQSRFKSRDAQRFVVTQVTFRLRAGGAPSIRYGELSQLLETTHGGGNLPGGSVSLEAVRSAVLTLRRRKSMVVDRSDPHSRSCGSFFTNPVLNRETFAGLRTRIDQSGSTEHIPAYATGDMVKVSAAWLVEHAGFPKGFRKGSVGVSANHSLALVNYGGTTAELLRLADEIVEGVESRFGVLLEREPVVV
jgi:UDP-N-acetylmuramate dehydrogenase